MVIGDLMKEAYKYSNPDTCILKHYFSGFSNYYNDSVRLLVGDKFFIIETFMYYYLNKRVNITIFENKTFFE